MTDTVPRHLRLAIANATRAFEDGDLARLGTVNEDIQQLVDAAVVWGRRQAASPSASRTVADRERDHLQAVERAWETGRIELSAIRGQPEHAERERLLSAGLLAMEEYMAARWVKQREPAPVLE